MNRGIDMEDKKITCIVCPNSCQLTISMKDNQWEVRGNSCNRGRDFAVGEVTNPKRTVCSTVKTVFKEVPRLSVRTDGEVPKESIHEVIKILSTVVVSSPIEINDVVVENILNTGINVIATSDLKYMLERYCRNGK